MDFDTERILNSNGQRYRVGWDEHGWFTIQTVEGHPEKDEWVATDAPLVSFPPSLTDELIEAIEDRP